MTLPSIYDGGFGEQLEAENAKLRKALESIILATCCGCSVYREIAEVALGLSDEEVRALRGLPPPPWRATRGDAVIYNNPASEFNGCRGMIVGPPKEAFSGPRFWRVHWDGGATTDVSEELLQKAPPQSGEGE